MPFTQVPGGQVYWKLEGMSANPALVLLNSIGTDMDLWEPTLPMLRERFCLLRIDTRGHGASHHDGGDVTMARLAQDIIAVADDAGFGSFCVAGVSLGGMVAMELALGWPDKVSRAALICTSATMDSAAWADRVDTVRRHGMAALADMVMQRFLSDQTRAQRPDLSETVRRNLLMMDAEAYAACGCAIRDMDLAARVEAISCPVLVVTGRHDSSTQINPHGLFLTNNIPDAIGKELDASHLAPLDCPEGVADALIEFCA